MEAARSCSVRQCKHAVQLLKNRRQAPARTLSSTPKRSRHGNPPVFAETPVQELNELLSNIRSKIFVPSHLTLRQKELVYRTRHASMLDAEPFVVELGSKKEPVQLKHIDRTKDLPEGWKSLLQCMKLMEDSHDSWGNFLGLLEGFKTSKKKWSLMQRERIVRTASERGMSHLVLEAVRRASKTGMYLRDLGIVREVFWSTRMKALQSGWDEEATRKAFRYAVQLTEILEDRDHAGRFIKLETESDPRIQPDIIGVLLELAAVRASKHLNGKDEEGEVATYAARLLPNIGKAASLESRKKIIPRFQILQPDYELLRWIPVLNGLKLAEGVLGENMPQPAPEQQQPLGSVKDVIRGIEERIRQWKTAASEVPAQSMLEWGNGRGLLWLQDFESA